MEARKRLGDLLIEASLLTQEDLEKALRLQVGGNRRLGYLLIKMGFISEQQLHSVLSEQLHLPIANISSSFTQEGKKILPRYLCNKYNVIPLATGEHNTLTLAMVDPSDNEAISDIEQYTGKVINPELAAQSEIKAAISSKIPWSFKDVFNSQTSSRVTAVFVAIALALTLIISLQYYKDKQLEEFGTVTQKNNATLYENHDLIIGFSQTGEVSLLGHGAHSQGYYSITFDDKSALSKFMDRKRSDLSTKQIEWLNWVVANH